MYVGGNMNTQRIHYLGYAHGLWHGEFEVTKKHIMHRRQIGWPLLLVVLYVVGFFFSLVLAFDFRVWKLIIQARHESKEEFTLLWENAVADGKIKRMKAEICVFDDEIRNLKP